MRETKNVSDDVWASAALVWGLNSLHLSEYQLEENSEYIKGDQWVCHHNGKNSAYMASRAWSRIACLELDTMMVARSAPRPRAQREQNGRCKQGCTHMS